MRDQFVEGMLKQISSQQEKNAEIVDTAVEPGAFRKHMDGMRGKAEEGEKAD